MSEGREMIAKYGGNCGTCSRQILKGENCWYDGKNIHCISCKKKDAALDSQPAEQIECTACRHVTEPGKHVIYARSDGEEIHLCTACNALRNRVIGLKKNRLWPYVKLGAVKEGANE